MSLTVIHPGTTKKVEMTITRERIRVETVMGDRRDENNDWLQVGVPMLRLYGFPFKKGNSICVLRT